MREKRQRQKDRDKQRRQYQRYLATEHWKETRNKVLKRAHGKCEKCCIRQATQVHHVSYKRMGKEKPEDLVALCTRCHRLEHPDKAKLSEHELRIIHKREAYRKKVRRQKKRQNQLNQAKATINNVKRRFDKKFEPTFEELAKAARQHVREHWVTVGSQSQSRAEAINSTGGR